MILIDFLMNALEILRIAGRLVLRPFRRVEQLPSFTVNLDQTEALWNIQAKDEWDTAYQEAVGGFPEFSRLALEERQAIEARLADKRLAPPKNTGDFTVFENCRVTSLGSLGAVVANARRLGPTDAPWNLLRAPGPVASGEEIERYRQLMLAKGVEWAGRE